MYRLFTIPSAALVLVLVTAAPATAGALLSLVAVGAQNLYLTDFTVQFDDGLTGTADGMMDLNEIVTGSFSGITDTSTETLYSTIVNVPDTAATVCDGCPDAVNWQFGGASSEEGVLVVPATSFTYATTAVSAPEPSSLLLLAFGLVALRRAGRR